MRDYEKLGLFYLGKRYDIDRRRRLEEPLLYDANDLVTHAVCVGMTGSGKTGLGIAMLEEAAIDGVPVIAIDPKGDLANLLLRFPAMTAADFAPWVDASTAAAQGIPVDELASREAAKWSRGLAEWDQDAARVGRLRDAADVDVFTPGSRVGRPLALLTSLGSGGQGDVEDAASRVGSAAAGLLALAGIADAQPHMREQTLIASILSQPDAAAGDLPWLVGMIQRPSFDRIGVLDLETFYPARERQDLALRFNSVLAAPGFDVWLQGEPLDADRLLFTPDGRPRVAIISIAHLADAERMLAVSFVLNAVLDWTRRQKGTGSLRALLYMDEVFGYLPPVANPPSKLPLLTLLKQARAFGVGVMLATQNPVDLDYKALSNAGTWFLGKLQTERDRARVLDGIDGLASTLDRQTLDRTLSALGSRVFLMHNVHDTAPVAFETRWTLSYLRGPLGRDELRRFAPASGSTVAPSRDSELAPTSASGLAPTVEGRVAPARASTLAPGARPILPAGITEAFLPGASGVMQPMLYGAARVHYTDARRGVDTAVDVSVCTPFGEGAVAVDWTNGVEIEVSPDAVATTPPDGARFGKVPAVALDPKRYAAWSRDFAQWLVRERPLRLLTVPELKLTSQPGELERDFRIRLRQALRERRDAAVAQLRARYQARIARLTGKVRKAGAARAREQQQAGEQQLQTGVSIGATLLGALMGRTAMSMSTLGRATTAARGVSRSIREQEDVARAEAQQRDAQAELESLQRELETEVAVLSSAVEPALQTVEIKPKRGGVEVRLVALAWLEKTTPNTQLPT